MDEYPRPINNHYLTKILDQMNNSFCKINEKDGNFEIGFFCFVKIREKNIPVLIINNNIKLEEYKDKIEVSINGKNKTIKLGNTKYQNEDYNMIILEIKENKKDKINFLEIDDAIYNTNSEMYYNKEPIYIIQFAKIKDIFLSYGVIKDMNKSHIIYSSEINHNSKLSLIFNLSNTKLIGKHETILKNYKQGKFFKVLINKFIKRYIVDHKYNKYDQLTNEINITIKIDKDDINKKIYFLDNYCYKDKENKEHFHDNLKELNELNTNFIVDGKKSYFKKYFIPDEIKLYNINLKFDKNLTDCSYMFAGCDKIVNIKFIHFNTENVKNMKYMFHRCKNIKQINLLSFNTKNVANLSYMFSECENLENIDISSFNFKKIENMDYMFYNCFKLNILISPYFDIKNCININNIFQGCQININNLNIKMKNEEIKDSVKDKFTNLTPKIPENNNLNINEIKNVNNKINSLNDNIKPNVDSIIEKLLSVRGYRPGKLVNLKEEEIKFVIDKSLPLIKKEKSLVELEAPLKVCGDIHGQYFELLRIFERCGYPSEYNYLFLGNYVDFGMQGLEVICLLLCYKIKDPNRITLLRGNHELTDANRIYGFYNECMRRYGVLIRKKFTDLFDYLPIAAIIDDKIFCVHGGLSPELKSPKDILSIHRPTDIPNVGLLCDLLNSDPDIEATDYDENDKGVSVIFGEKVVLDFNKMNNLDLIVRGNQVVKDGYEFFASRQLITIFSASNFKGEYDNSGGILNIDESLTCDLTTLRPVKFT